MDLEKCVKFLSLHLISPLHNLVDSIVLQKATTKKAQNELKWNLALVNLFLLLKD